MLPEVSNRRLRLLLLAQAGTGKTSASGAGGGTSSDGNEHGASGRRSGRSLGRIGLIGSGSLIGGCLGIGGSGSCGIGRFVQLRRVSSDIATSSKRSTHRHCKSQS